MRALVFHFSTLVGLLVFLNQVGNTAEIERTILVAFATGAGIYVVLLFGYAAAHRILAFLKNHPADDPAGPAATAADDPAS